MRRYRVLSQVMALAVVTSLSASCSGCRRNDASEGAASGPASVSVEVARPQTLRVAVSGPGLISPSAAGDWTIHSTETGRIAALTKHEGDAVESGEVLVRFEYPTSANTLAQETELDAANGRLTAARADLTKVTPLFDRGYASRAELETARGAVTSAELEVARTKRVIEVTALEADRAVVRARFNGTVAKLFHNEGDLVNGTIMDPVMRVVDPKQVEVVMSVQIQDLGQVQIGQQATVLSANGAEPAAVTLRPIPTDPRATTQDIRLSFANTAQLAIDTPVSVEILLAERPSVIALPTAAVIHDGADKSYVMIVTEDGHAQRREVGVGLTARDRVEILTGVAAGDRVIVKDATTVAEGSVVVTDK